MPTMVGSPPGQTRVASATSPACTRSMRLVRSGPDLAVEVLELLRGEAGRLTDRDDLPLVRFDIRHRLRDLVGDLVGNGGGTVLVGVDQIAGLDPEPTHLHGNAEVDHVHPRVRHGDVRRGELEA